MNNFTPRAQEALALARKEAASLHHHYVGTEHLLLGLLSLGQGVAINVLEKMGLDFSKIREEILKQSEPVGGEEALDVSSIPYTPRIKKVLALAAKEARALQHSYVGTEHLLLGLLREGEGVGAQVLRKLNIDIEQTRNEILKELDPHLSSEEEGEPKTETPALSSFGRDLTAAAQQKELDPVIGRTEEIARVIQILCRRTKNNPVLIGEAGVGKTAVAEGLAQAIVDGLVPEILAQKKVFTLDLALLVAGTKYRGQFEERLKYIMEEIRKNKNIILFIDELHTVVGAGSGEGSMDASNIIKPALGRGELQCIGATTLTEYRKHIEKDTALERRFQIVKIEEPSIEDAILILKGVRSKYEEHHKAVITDAALEAAVRLSDRYIPARFLPDKAIDVMDEAGARARIASLVASPHVKEIEKEIELLRTKKENAIKDQNFEEAASVRDEEKKAKENLEKVLARWKKEHQEKEILVEESDIEFVLSKMTGIPLERLDKKDAERLLGMEKEIEQKIIGQEEAITAISKALRRSRAGLKDPQRPIGSFIFLGPTGVGKTFLAKTLAEFMFGDSEALIQVDMSEYMEKFTSSRMIGSPPGYVGHDEGGQLSEAVRRRPYSVVLFDEIEKAHPDVMNLMLQILEEGKITDSQGRKIDFRNTIIIMTSNVGAELIKKQNVMGFGAPVLHANKEALKEKLIEEAKKAFKPEFLNRLDDVIVFQPLDRDSLSQIVTLEIDKVLARIKNKEIHLTLTKEAEELLMEKGYDPSYGARPMRRAVEQLLEHPMAEEILKQTICSGNHVCVSREGEKLSFKVEEQKVPEKNSPTLTKKRDPKKKKKS